MQVYKNELLSGRMLLININFINMPVTNKAPRVGLDVSVLFWGLSDLSESSWIFKRQRYILILICLLCCGSLLIANRLDRILPSNNVCLCSINCIGWEIENTSLKSCKQAFKAPRQNIHRAQKTHMSHSHLELLGLLCFMLFDITISLIFSFERTSEPESILPWQVSQLERDIHTFPLDTWKWGFSPILRFRSAPVLESWVGSIWELWINSR